MKHAFLLVAMTFAYPRLAVPQGDSSGAAFIESARVATAKYQDRSVAIA